MKSGFIRMPAKGMADPTVDPPEPVPFPIKIVSDPAPPLVDTNLPDLPPAGKRCDDFYVAWEKFLAVQPQRAKQTSRAAREIENEKEAVENSPGDGLRTQENAAKSWQEAADECQAKVNAIVDECKRLNQKYRDAIFDLEASPWCLQSLSGRCPKAVDKIDPPPWIKRVEDIFDDPQFFIDGASASDVHQGSGGDCWFLASLMAVSAKKELIDKLCVARDEKVGVYGFVFFRDGEWIHEVIDDKLFLRVGDDDDLAIVRDWDINKKEGFALKHDEDKLMDSLQKGGTALYFSHCKSNETWLPLIEKAYAKAHGDYFAIEGGFASEGIEDITGGVAVVLNPEDIMDKDRFWRDQLLQVNKKYLFGGGSKPTGSKNIVGGHAYAVLEAWEEGDLRLLKLRNPWGETEWEGDWSDGSKLWTADMMTKLKHTFGDDGIFWISYKDCETRADKLIVLKHFPCINRVRLFDEDWSVGQQWTCVSVPWTVDYLDTKFQFTVTERGPVVVVLAQPDDRYFYGLRGRYLHSMHFRVYKDGDDGRWIVRSMHNSGNETIFTRSVSAEMEDLEPGTYNVVFKVTAVRTAGSTTAEEAIMKYAVERKEKLLHVGRRFDYAQTKGNLKGMEEALRKQKRQTKKEKQNSNFRKARKLNQQERERARRRKKRVDDAMREKRKAFESKRREKAKARKNRANAAGRRENESTDAQAGAPSDSSQQGEKKDAVTPVSSQELAKPEDTAQAKDAETGAEAAEPEEQQQQQQQTESKDKKAVTTATTSTTPTTSSPETQESKAATENLSKQLSSLKLQEISSSEEAEEEEEDEEYDSPVEPPEELDDDDFDWDSEIDGPVDSDSDSEEQTSRKSSKYKNEIFGDDPWQALCVLGLRVYSKCKDVKVRVVKGDGDL